MLHVIFRALIGVCLFAGFLHAAPNGSLGAIYERIICVVPMVGTGTLDDPRRPMFAPIAGQEQQSNFKRTKGFLEAPTIVSYHSVVTDDGSHAIVEFVARDRAAFQQILGSKSSLQTFDLRLTSRETLLTALRKLKKDFDLGSFLEGAL